MLMGINPSPNIIQRKEGCFPTGTQSEIWLAGGCFWGLQEYLDRVEGVFCTNVGYANGQTLNPTYEQVCSHTTGYAETVHVVYDTAVISLPFLLDLFYKAIDPTSLNRQGGDIGEQYRTGIYYGDAADLPVIEASIGRLAEKLDKPVAIEVKPLDNYYLAEEYHQDYLKKTPGGYCHIPQKLFSYASTAREYRAPDEGTLRNSLTPLQYEVTQNSATEPPFQNEYNSNFQPGIYVDITTGEPLFLSTDKFESGCGWPAFSRPISDALLEQRADTTYGMYRTEVRSSTGDAHLGHVFEDGPPDQGGLRYCINSAALRFVPRAEMAEQGYGHLLPLVEGEEGRR